MVPARACTSMPMTTCSGMWCANQGGGGGCAGKRASPQPAPGEHSQGGPRAEAAPALGSSAVGTGRQVWTKAYMQTDPEDGSVGAACQRGGSTQGQMCPFHRPSLEAWRSGDGLDGAGHQHWCCPGKRHGLHRGLGQARQNPGDGSTNTVWCDHREADGPLFGPDSTGL